MWDPCGASDNEELTKPQCSGSPRGQPTATPSGQVKITACHTTDEKETATAESKEQYVTVLEKMGRSTDAGIDVRKPPSRAIGPAEKRFRPSRYERQNHWSNMGDSMPEFDLEKYVALSDAWHRHSGDDARDCTSGYATLVIVHPTNTTVKSTEQ